MRHLFLLALIVGALVASSSAGARLARPTWTVAQVEQAVADSDFFADNALEDLTCQGRGRAYLTPSNEPSFRVFRCRFYYQDDNDEEQTFTAYVRVIANPDRFSTYGFSDDSFNPNSPCYQQVRCY